MGEGCTQVGGEADPNGLSIVIHPPIHCASKITYIAVDIT